MKKGALVLPISIIIGCFILGGFFYCSQINKQKLINQENLLKIQAENQDIAKKEENKNLIGEKVELIYNKSTGELYPILPDDAAVHSCVWTIWGDHGSDTVVVTKSTFLDENSDETIKMNGFLPPRVPIFVSCINWQNEVYSGSIGEY
ncbi:MAG: hypothetical protein WCY05_07945 [Candidatus Omnitrophota bacterium]